MKSEPINLNPYEAKYGDLLEQLSRAVAEAAGTGDGMAFLFLLESVSAIIAHGEKLLAHVSKEGGHC
jgi:hypothetical protein